MKLLARCCTCSNCCVGVAPVLSRVRRPSSFMSCRPPTRTMKNSSRLEAVMARNFARSSTGRVLRAASSSTRSLKASHDSSRLMKWASVIGKGAAGMGQQDKRLEDRRHKMKDGRPQEGAGLSYRCIISCGGLPVQVLNTLEKWAADL